MLITSVDKAYELFNNYKSDKDLGLAIENVFTALTLRDGFSMSKKPSHIVRVWEQIKGEKGKIYKIAKELLSTISDPEELKKVTDTASRCKSDWLYSPSYDPKKL